MRVNMKYFFRVIKEIVSEEAFSAIRALYTETYRSRFKDTTRCSRSTLTDFLTEMYSLDVVKPYAVVIHHKLVQFGPAVILATLSTQ